MITIENVFWRESGIWTFGNIGLILKHIERYGFWLMENRGCRNHNFTHTQCEEIMIVIYTYTIAM